MTVVCAYLQVSAALKLLIFCTAMTGAKRPMLSASAYKQGKHDANCQTGATTRHLDLWLTQPYHPFCSLG